MGLIKNIIVGTLLVGGSYLVGNYIGHKAEKKHYESKDFKTEIVGENSIATVNKTTKDTVMMNFLDDMVTVSYQDNKIGMFSKTQQDGNTIYKMEPITNGMGQTQQNKVGSVGIIEAGKNTYKAMKEKYLN